MQFSDYRQKDSMLCGITCLQMICKYYGAYLKLNYLQELCQEGREGISLAALKQGTESLGFECLCGFANTKEHRHHGDGSNSRHSRTTHAGYDACRAVHHRTTQLAC